MSRSMQLDLNVYSGGNGGFELVGTSTSVGKSLPPALHSPAGENRCPPDEPPELEDEDDEDRKPIQLQERACVCVRIHWAVAVSVT